MTTEEKLIKNKLGRKVVVPDDPQLVGAYGAALLIKEKAGISKKSRLF